MADQSPVKKRGEENSAEKERGKKKPHTHKKLDDKEIDKIEEDRHEVNTKQNTVWPVTVKC